MYGSRLDEFVRDGHHVFNGIKPQAPKRDVHGDGIDLLNCTQRHTFIGQIGHHEVQYVVGARFQFAPLNTQTEGDHQTAFDG